MNNFKKIIILIIFPILSACSAVKEGFNNPKKNSNDEFFVEKKSPLTMPPNFNELPIPENEKKNMENKSNNIKSLITDKNISDKKTENTEVYKNFEQSILEKIKNN